MELIRNMPLNRENSLDLRTKIGAYVFMQSSMNLGTKINACAYMQIQELRLELIFSFRELCGVRK
jgi:hypothetical protein